MMISTRRAASFGTPRTPPAAGLLCALACNDPYKTTTRHANAPATCNLRFMKSFALADDHILFGVVEGHALAGLQGGNRHRERRRVIVSRVDVGIRRLARAHALHAVAPVQERRLI